MKRITLRLAVTVLTFIIGLAVAGLWLSKSTTPKKCIHDPYFPAGAFSQRIDRKDWITEFYSALQEQPFSCLDDDIEAYRFLFIPSFEPPASIRVWREGGQRFIELRQLSRVGT